MQESWPTFESLIVVQLPYKFLYLTSAVPVVVYCVVPVLRLFASSVPHNTHRRPVGPSLPIQITELTPNHQ